MSQHRSVHGQGDAELLPQVTHRSQPVRHVSLRISSNQIWNLALCFNPRIFRAHIVFAILDVVKTDFPSYYNDYIHPDIFVHFHYPFYRWPMRILQSFLFSKNTLLTRNEDWILCKKQFILTKLDKRKRRNQKCFPLFKIQKKHLLRVNLILWEF